MARILIIDDDPTVLVLISELLEVAGHSVLTAVDGRAGTHAFKHHDIDLVVTDIIMPEQEGIATIGAIRRLNATVPILAISGSATIGSSADYLRAAEALGASASLPKPIVPEMLIAVVDQLLR